MDYFFPQDIITSILGVFILSLLVLKYLSWRSRPVGKTHAPPEAGGAWPIIGHLHLLGGAADGELPHKKLGSLADKYGPIFTIRLGNRRAMVVSSPELAKQLFTAHDLASLSRPKLLVAKHIGYDYAMFGFSPYGPYWRELRKIISLELLSTRRLELLKHVRLSETETCITELYKKWTSHQKTNPSSPSLLVDMKKWLGDLTMNVILRMVAGKRYYGGDATDEEARRCRKVTRDFFYFSGVFVLGDFVPWLGWVDIGGYEKGMKMAGEEMDRICEGWLEEHRRRRGSGEKDFMDVMMSAVDGADLTGFHPDTIVKSTCMAMISGGSDTTLVTMIWALSLLLNNREALKKLQEELDAHVGRNRRVEETDISKLHYLQAVVKETLRLYPAGPLSGFREFTEDCVINGYEIQEGTRLIMNIWKLQRDPHVWEDPAEFKPERFLSTHKGVDVKGQHFELIPFSAGRRICPGVNFGLQIIHLVLANLLHGFDVRTPCDERVDMTESVGITNLKATPLDVLIAPRLSSTLY